VAQSKGLTLARGKPNKPVSRWRKCESSPPSNLFELLKEKAAGIDLAEGGQGRTGEECDMRFQTEDGVYRRSERDEKSASGLTVGTSGDQCPLGERPGAIHDRAWGKASTCSKVGKIEREGGEVTNWRLKSKNRRKRGNRKWSRYWQGKTDKGHKTGPVSEGHNT